PDALKVSATFRDGFRAAGTLTIIGRHAEAKARRVGEQVLQRVREAGFTLRDAIVETLGSRVGAYKKVDPRPEHFGESVLRVAVEATSRDAVERFSQELMPYITAGPQGTTGYAEGRPRVHSVFRYWPCLIARDSVAPQVTLLASTESATDASTKVTSTGQTGSSTTRSSQTSRSETASTAGVR